LNTTTLISIVVFVVIAVGIVLFSRRKAGGTSAYIPVETGISMLNDAFARLQQPGEHKPLCFLAMEKRVQYFVGVTDKRWLIVDAAGEAQDISRDQKFMRMFHQGGIYEANLIHPAFKGRKWQLYPEITGYPEQKSQLKAMFELVGFRWMG